MPGAGTPQREGATGGLAGSAGPRGAGGRGAEGLSVESLLRQLEAERRRVRDAHALIAGLEAQLMDEARPTPAAAVAAAASAGAAAASFRRRGGAPDDEGGSADSDDSGDEAFSLMAGSIGTGDAAAAGEGEGAAARRIGFQIVARGDAPEGWGVGDGDGNGDGSTEDEDDEGDDDDIDDGDDMDVGWDFDVSESAEAGASVLAAAAHPGVDEEAYLGSGYLTLRELFPPGAAAELRGAVLAPFADGEWEGSARVVPVFDEQGAGIDQDNPHGLRFVQQLALVDPKWLRLAVHPRLLALAATLLGADVNLHHVKASLKPPGHVSRQGWHQDAYYLHEDPPEFITVLLSLDETAAGAGATKIAIGSHRNGLLQSAPTDVADPARADGLPRDGGSIAPDVAEQQGRVVEPELIPGDAIVLSPFVVHSVGDNHTSSTKCSVAFVYKSAAAVDREPGGNWRAFAELPVLRDGRPAVSFHL